MTHEEIIKAWFSIDELGGENVFTTVESYLNMLYRTPQKMYRAYIRFGLGYEFYAHEKDIYTAMEKVINQYSEFITKNEIK
ncbi:MAG: hypothetical protein KBT34_07315 [Prevotella sp.]|nr:hypothetical protein [Candidatus Prevotella equi]